MDRAGASNGTGGRDTGPEGFGAGGSSAALRLLLRVPEELRFLLTSRHRRAELRLSYAAGSFPGTAGHVVQSLGLPLTEVGELLANGRPVDASYRPRDGDELRLLPPARPQPVPGPGTDGAGDAEGAGEPPRFRLDVHLGALARRLRLLGVDAAYHADAGDDWLLDRANAEHRVLLTRDRGLLRRRALWLGAYVRGTRTDDQLADVLDRFAPPLAPWTRCMACGGVLESVAKEDIAHLLEPGTRRTYRTFMRCPLCGRLYWRGAHSEPLEAIVAAALARDRGAKPEAHGGPGGDGESYDHAK